MVGSQPSSRKDLLNNYHRANIILAQGGEVYIEAQKGSLVFPPINQGKGLEGILYPRIGIYTGGGASHSWLWMVDLLEAIACYDLCFADELAVREGALQDLDVFFVGGGDTFAIAEALGSEGAAELRWFVQHGGIYLGSCAGAYLLMDLSGPPFEPFGGFTHVQLANVSATLPPCRCMPTKFYSPYGAMYVIHPVRESVILKISNCAPFFHGGMLIAPLYGGPAMLPSPQEIGLAWYDRFTEDTLFLGDKDVGGELLLGKAAIVQKNFGNGAIWLFGPHCEHPQYPAANHAMVSAMYAGMGRQQIERHYGFQRFEENADCTVQREILQEIKKHVSNARIMVLGMESTQVHWLIGKKSYEPEKIRFFLEAVWTRLLKLMQQSTIAGRDVDMVAVLGHFSSISRDIKTLAQGIQDGDEMTPLATRLFTHLKEKTASFLKIYFLNRYLRLVG